jgi:beta-lactamase class D
MTYLFALFVFLLGCQAQTTGWEESPEVAALFDRAGVTGTFVLFDVSEQRLIGYDRARAEARFVPASTFKVPNTLIGLSVGAVVDVDEILPYGGTAQPFAAWEKDMGLREAITLSNVPIYQELARRIGMERMGEYISRLGYGNNDIGTALETFWLDGPLEISAIEQTRFLVMLAQGTLPLPQDVQTSVREIVLLEQGENWQLYGKTGWQNVPGPGVGWWVGWVQHEDRLYAFALNMDIRQASDAGKRVELGRASLDALGVLGKP